MAAEASRKQYWLLLFIPAGIALAYIYFNYDPAVYPFPSCPSKKFLGISCPGCGSQRALHQLLHGNVAGALSYNPFFIIAVPYVILGYIFQIKKVRNKYPKTRKFFFGVRAIWVVFTLVLGYMIVRNILNF